MEQNRTPFADQDMIRRSEYQRLYYWAKGIGKNPMSAHFIAKAHTLKKFPIIPGEPLYPHHLTHV